MHCYYKFPDHPERGKMDLKQKFDGFVQDLKPVDSLLWVKTPDKIFGSMYAWSLPTYTRLLVGAETVLKVEDAKVLVVNLNRP